MALAEVALLVPFLKVDFQDYFKKKLPANCINGGMAIETRFSEDIKCYGFAKLTSSFCLVAATQGLSSVGDCCVLVGMISTSTGSK